MVELLKLENVSVAVNEAKQEKFLLKDVSFSVPRESIVGLVGGSGSGKTTTGLAILRLLPLGLQMKQGEILFDGKNLGGLSEENMRQLRGKEISMIFQEPLNAFNPVFSIGYQVNEVLEFHTKLSRAQRQSRILDLLDLAGIADPKRIAGQYPHQLSGGLRQRAMIAQAIAADPKLIIADEPTSNLDVTLQAQIMELFLELKDKLKLSILLITHDLGLVARQAHNLVVMKEGRVVEQGATQEVMQNPRHAYTQQLMQAFA